MMPMLRTNCPIRAVDIVVFISRILPAPKSCDITTLQPMDKPEARATARKTTGKEAPTAFRGVGPDKIAHYDGVYHVVQLLETDFPSA